MIEPGKDATDMIKEISSLVDQSSPTTQAPATFLPIYPRPIAAPVALAMHENLASKVGLAASSASSATTDIFSMPSSGLQSTYCSPDPKTLQASNTITADRSRTISDLMREATELRAKVFGGNA